jgi:hypothetical protein
MSGAVAAPQKTRGTIDGVVAARDEPMPAVNYGS